MKVVRLHTRVPAVAPERVTAALVSALKRSGKAVYVALHANHPRELTAEARAACARLIDAGIPMLSQSVLLRGVNDDPQVLAELMRAFVETRIRPYYLHHGDAAPGTSHLRLTLEEGRALVRSLRGAHLRPRPADLRPRHPRRPRQGPGRARLPVGGRHGRWKTPGARFTVWTREGRALLPPCGAPQGGTVSIDFRDHMSDVHAILPAAAPRDRIRAKAARARL